MKGLIIDLLMFLLVKGYLSASDSLSKNENSSQFQFNGQTLIDMGIKLNKPLLKLIGKTVMGVENKVRSINVVEELCRLHPCSEWSEWSKCDAIHNGDFGGQTRSRECGLNTTLCKHNLTPTIEHDTRVCEFSCPENYTSTGHGFCLKFYDKEKLPRDDAEKVCQADGGHLVNVDSETKVKLVNETILKQSFSGDIIWIDGRRYKPSDPFQYGYMSTDPSFTFWGDNDPDNEAYDLCINYLKNADTNYFWRWFDNSCSGKNPFICQFQ